MNLLVINAHWYNRGDEAAIRAMLREIKRECPNANIRIQAALPQMHPEDSEIEGAKVIGCFPTGRKQILHTMAFIGSMGKICLSEELKNFVENVKWADLLIHAPGGPSISDTYGRDEPKYLCRLALAKKLKKPYMFYAPSMGPFTKKRKSLVRKWILNSAEMIIVREAISKEYLQSLHLKKDVTVALDSAFQTPINEEFYEKELLEDKELAEFFNTDKKIVGITITPLRGNPAYANDLGLRDRILECFSRFVQQLDEDGYKIIFIPQLFGKANDYNFMSECAVSKNSYVMQPTHNCFFQQYVIGKLHMVFGMRYHSNIFSAKMGTPFVSISYEQKMKGFMELTDLTDLCLDIKDLTYDNLIEKYKFLVENYDYYKKYLSEKKAELKNLSHITTDKVVELIEKID